MTFFYIHLMLTFRYLFSSFPPSTTSFFDIRRELVYIQMLGISNSVFRRQQRVTDEDSMVDRTNVTLLELNRCIHHKCTPKHYIYVYIHTYVYMCTYVGVEGWTDSCTLVGDGKFTWTIYTQKRRRSYIRNTRNFPPFSGRNSIRWRGVYVQENLGKFSCYLIIIMNFLRQKLSSSRLCSACARNVVLYKCMLIYLIRYKGETNLIVHWSYLHASEYIT